MSQARTAKQFAREIDRITGEHARARYAWFSGWYLEIGSFQYPLGVSAWDMLSPADQKSICRAIGRPDLIVLLGLDPDDQTPASDS